jgi:signal transduction histidine kinase
MSSSRSPAKGNPRARARGAAIVCCFVSILVTLFPAMSRVQPVGAGTPWRVVILHNADFLLPTSIIMDQTLREVLIREASRPIELHGETLDQLRYPHEIEPELVSLLRKKYIGKRVDVVLARSQGALDFATRYRDELWPGVPVVFYNNLAESLREVTRAPNSTGLLIALDPASTIALAQRLQPGARHLYLVGGTAEYDVRWKRRIEAILRQSFNALDATWLDDVPLPRILEQLSHLPPESVVLFTSMVRDASGLPREGQNVAELIAEAANAPVYGFFDNYVGRGVVGGATTDLAAQGAAAARLALRILNGESASKIPIQESPPARCVVDARALERWHIEESQLPAGCDVRFRAPSLWRDYRWQVLGTSIALVLQSLLLAALVVQRRRRQRAESEVDQRRSELMQASRLALAGQMTASIAHEINQPLGAILVNTGAAKAMLEGVPPNLDEVRQILDDIYKEDLRASEVIRRVRALLTKGEAERLPTDVNAIVADTLSLLEAESRRRGVAINSSLASDLPSILLDRTQLRQALINLCINAMDATDDLTSVQRRIEVTTVACGTGAVEIAVGDWGAGINPRELPKLFESFFTTKPHGMGLGLSITRSIVEAHGGTLSGENRAEGGAIFRVVLPCAGVEAPTRDDISEARAGGIGR